MKQRDLFWVNRILLIFFLGMVFIGISIWNMLYFNKAYIQEEQSELELYRKQIEYISTYFIKNNRLDELENFASIFKNNNEFSFQIYDNKKIPIVKSSNIKRTKIIADDKRYKKKYNIIDLYLYSFEDKSIEKITEFKIKDKKYFLEVSLSQKHVINSIIQAHKYIILLFCVIFIFLIIGIIHILYSIRKSFNSLEDSIIKIANGDLDASINLPKTTLLSELSLAIKNMKVKLKNQIERLILLEKYRSEFVSNITHEIKTPITAINSAIELLETTPENNNLQKECFDIIKFQTNSINQLVGDILTLSEIDLEKTNDFKNFEKINLNDVIKIAINNQGISNIVFNSNKSDIEIVANEKLVMIMISNLLNNAIKYSNSKQIDVSVNEKDNNIVVEIKDYGIGIDKIHLPRIFERFYRIDKNRSRQNGGTGLGLAIVKHIIELHNWKIEVESELTRGTTFRIII